ncbi:MAG: methyltransferase domain-containing protein [Bacillota bacterium]|nr:methyltransferase domain-containing protein [Bacillota bacterium]
MAKQNKKENIRKPSTGSSEDARRLLALALEDEKARREALSSLSSIAKTKQGRKETSARLDELGRGVLYGLLHVPDPKARKNTAVLLGALSDARDCDALIAAHQAEPMGYVRASIILALGNMGNGALAYLLSLRLDENSPVFQQEKHALSLALSKLSSIRHDFISLGSMREIALRTIPGFERDLYLEALQRGLSADITGAGEVTASTSDYHSLFMMRAFYEALIPIDFSLPLEASQIASSICKADIYGMLRAMHGCPGPFGYRVEIRGDMTHETRVKLARGIAAQINLAGLINSPSSYDAEMRIECGGALCSIYIKLHSYRDERFSYRVQDVPAAIMPPSAAALMLRLKSRMGGASRVLDPFCGSGTLLFERALAMPCRSLTGVDVSRHAIQAARANAQKGEFKAAFVHSDILRFRHSRPFDEIYSNMPFGHRSQSHSANIRLYKGFFEMLPSLLTESGFAALLTMEKRLFRECLASSPALAVVSEKGVETGNMLPSLFILQKER